MDENVDLANQELIEINDLNLLKNFNLDDIYIILNFSWKWRRNLCKKW